MLQEKKDAILSLVDEVYALGVQAGQSGGAIYTEEQLIQAVQNAIAVKEQEKVEALNALKSMVLSKIEAQRVAEEASEVSLIQEIQSL